MRHATQQKARGKRNVQKKDSRKNEKAQHLIRHFTKKAHSTGRKPKEKKEKRGRSPYPRV